MISLKYLKSVLQNIFERKDITDIKSSVSLLNRSIIVKIIVPFVEVINELNEMFDKKFYHIKYNIKSKLTLLYCDIVCTLNRHRLYW